MAQPQGRPILGARSQDSMPPPEPSNTFNMMSIQSVLPPEGPARSKRPPVSEVMGASTYPSNFVPGIDTSRPPPPLLMGAPDTQPLVASGMSVNARSFEPTPRNFESQMFSTSSLSASAKSFEPQQLPVAGLSASARVFEPQQNFNAMQPQQFRQLTTGNQLNANASEFVPQYAFAPNDNWYYSEAGYGEEWVEGAVADSLTCVCYAMEALNMQPGDFDSVMPELTASLEQCIYDEPSLLVVINQLAERAIVEPNFRYTASRMCHHLSENLEASSPTGNFRQHLLQWIRLEFGRRNEMNADPLQRERLFGFTLFLAELFVNITIKNGQRMLPLSDAVKTLVMMLLSASDEASLKCAGQVLKLTGSALVDFESSTTNPSLKDIIDKVKLVVLDAKCHKSVKNMFISIIELSAKNWGRESETEVTGAAALPEQMGTTYYDQGHPVVKQDEDGAGLDEQDLDEDFLLQEQFINELLGDGDHPTYEDAEYSDEIALAYEQFLKDSEQHTQKR